MMMSAFRSDIKKMTVAWLRCIFLLSCIMCIFTGCSQTSFRGPGPAQTGPGSSEYEHGALTYARFRKKEFQYFIFTPCDPVPERAPVIVLLHGWGAMSPYRYGAWIEHLVRRGNIVIYPRMQSSITTDNGGLTYTALDSIRHALGTLDKGAVKPDMERFAVVGHSAGGNAAVNVAALAASRNIPVFKAVMCVQPGLEYSKSGRKWTVLEDLSLVPEETLLLITLGDRDDFVKGTDARKIFLRTGSIPLENKGYVMLVSDDYGVPVLEASHQCAQCPDSRFRLPLGRCSDERPPAGTIVPLVPSPYPGKYVNALDYYGLWKLFDGLYEAAFYGKNREYALGNTDRQRYMGMWEDGTPVREIQNINP